MSLQKDNKTIEQYQKQHMEDKIYLWIQEKANNNFNKDGKSKCFNCNVYGHMVKDYKEPKIEQDTRKCYKCKMIGHIAKNY